MRQVFNFAVNIMELLILCGFFALGASFFLCDSDTSSADEGDDFDDGGDDGAGGDDGTGGEEPTIGMYFEGTPDADLISGTESNDTIVGLGGDDTLRGQDGDDTITGSADNDNVNGGRGDDLLIGEGGDDYIYGDRGNDLIGGDAGDDYLSGNLGADTIVGGTGEDTLRGGAGDDWIIGFVDSTDDEVIDETDVNDPDLLLGNDGEDIIWMGSGDTANGGADADIFLTGTYVDGSAAPVVEDFTPGEDVLAIYIPSDEVDTAVVEITDVGGDAQVTVNGEVVATLLGVGGTMTVADLGLAEAASSETELVA